MPKPTSSTKRAPATESSASHKIAMNLFGSDAERVKAIRNSIFAEAEEIATTSEIIRFALRSVGKVDVKAFLAMRGEMKTEDGRARRHAEKK